MSDSSRLVSPEMDSPHSTRILLVEESPAEARAIQEILVDSGTEHFEVEVAERPAIALQRLSREGFDIVVVDLSPPGGSLENLAAIRDAAGDLPIMVLTPPGEEELAFGALWMGAQDYVFKGRIQPEDLLARSLRHILELHQSQNKLHEQDQLLAQLEAQTGMSMSAPVPGPRHRSESGYMLEGDSEAVLRTAFERGRLRLLYEPILRVEDGSLVGFEAHLHCPDPFLSRLEAGDLLRIAETAGMTAPLTTWIIAESCWRLSTWLHLRGSGEPDLAMYVNLPPGSLHCPHLMSRLEAALVVNDLPAEHLMVQVTDVACSRLPGAAGVLQRIRDMGVRVALADTGLAAPSALRWWPVDQIKIGRPLVIRPDSAGGSAILATILNSAHHSDLEIVAEGVDSEMQFSRLRALGCDLAQGPLLGRPCEPEIARALVSTPFGLPT